MPLEKLNLPDPLLGSNGKKITNPSDWMEYRRAEIFQLFQSQVYGISPAPPPEKAALEIVERSDRAMSGTGIRIQGNVICKGVPERIKPFPILIYLPKNISSPVPVFLGLNFKGNHACDPDPEILIPKEAVLENGSLLHERGEAVSRYPIQSIIDRGFGVATIWYNHIEWDENGRWKDGVRGAYSPDGQLKPDDWAAIGAWAWGLSRAFDALESVPEIDSSRIIVWGHSRLGKTALWASASDPRFAMAVSNDSGCTGASISRGKQGESVAKINELFPHWFCGNYKQYGNNEDALPVDQHELIALTAPRPVYVASAINDTWADFSHEFLGAKHASPVYRLFGYGGIGEDTEMPPIHTPVGGDRVGYHVRAGEHDVTEYDWLRFIDFAKRNLFSKCQSE